MVWCLYEFTKKKKVNLLVANWNVNRIKLVIFRLGILNQPRCSNGQRRITYHDSPLSISVWKFYVRVYLFIALGRLNKYYVKHLLHFHRSKDNISVLKYSETFMINKENIYVSAFQLTCGPQPQKMSFRFSILNGL